MKLYSPVWAALVAVGLLLLAALGPLSPENDAVALDAIAPTDTVLVWDPTDSRVSDPDSLFPGDIKSLYEASIAVDPTDPSNVLAWGIDLSTGNLQPYTYSTNRYYRSQDGGASWTDMGPMPYRDGDAYWGSGDPVGLFTPEGTAYFASLASAPDGSEGGIYVHRSDDGGATWNAPVLAVAETSDGSTCTGTDKEWLSHDASSGTLYLAYSLFVYGCDALVPGGDPTGATDLLRFEGIALWITKSTDGGASWAEPVKVQDGYKLGGIPRAAPDGTLHMAWYGNALTSKTLCPALFGVLGTAVFHEPGLFDAIFVGTSHDGGQTWSIHQESKCTFDMAETTKPGRFVGGNFLPALSVDPADGAAYVVFPYWIPEENRYTIKMIASTDGGATWSDAIEVTPGTEDARMPTVHAKDGVVRIAYLISRDSDSTGDAAYTESTDGGGAWSERILLTSEPFQLADDPDLGDYIGIDVNAGRINVIWTDARNGLTTEIWTRGGTIE